MMPFSPYFGYPYYRIFPSRSHNSSNQKVYNQKKELIPKDFSNRYNVNNNFNNCNTHSNHFNNDTFNNNCNFTNAKNNCNNSPNNYTISINDTDSYDYEQFINIFGFKLYFDDLLILALLFFLYKEEVKDESLYIALILLLLT